jgi:thiamine kinase-like enzyme
MAPPESDPEDIIRALPIWTRRVDIEPLHGGITNKNYLVTDGDRRAVARFGGDMPVHGVMRFNELSAARAAAAAGVSPKVLYSAPSVLVMDHIRGRTFAPEDVRANVERCVSLVKRVHCDMPAHLRGPTLSFNVFHIIRDYAHTLAEDESRMAQRLPHFLAAGAALEKAVGPIELVFGHNDLLAANFIDDGSRLWLVDWDYAGWNTPLFDLGGLASNNDFDAAETEAMLSAYFGRPVDDASRCRFSAMLCASLLREAMWSMVSERRSTIDFDYVSYTHENLRRFEDAYAAFNQPG